MGVAGLRWGLGGVGWGGLGWAGLGRFSLGGTCSHWIKVFNTSRHLQIIDFP